MSATPSVALASPRNDRPEIFKKFSKFPIKIRRKIWRSTFPRPRFIDTSDRCNSNDYQVFSSHSNPIALSVCRESRDEARKHYKLRLMGLHAFYIDMQVDWFTTKDPWKHQARMMLGTD
jgi:hypothetical protein